MLTILVYPPSHLHCAVHTVFQSLNYYYHTITSTTFLLWSFDSFFSLCLITCSASSLNLNDNLNLHLHQSTLYLNLHSISILIYRSSDDPQKISGGLASRSELSYPLKEPADRGFFFLFCYQLWRFLPDLMSISIGFLMSTIGSLYDADVGSTMWFVILPTVFLAYFIVNYLQKGSARYNLSRFFLECAPISTMGYASYAIYLFQRQAFSFYATYFYFGVKEHGLNRTTGDRRKWFERLNGGYKVIAVLVLVIICWLIHRYYQDRFITHLYAKFLQRRRSTAAA